MNCRILLALCLALVAESAHGQPLVKIAFVTDRDGNDEIYTVQPDGSDLVNLTRHPAADHYPAWSPDGRRIAFVSDRDGDNDIYTMTAGGTDVTNLTRDAGDDQRPAWSPDGTRIAFLSNRDGESDLYVMASDGSSPVNLTMGAVARNGRRLPITDGPYWSPDGSRLAFRSAFVHPRVPTRRLYLVDADGDNLTELTSDRYFSRPSWSPDGQSLAYTAQSLSPASADAYRGALVRDLFRVDVDGEGRVELSDHLDRQGNPAWSPDGTSVVVTVDPYYGWEASTAHWWGFNRCLYVYSAEGGGERELFCTDVDEGSSPFFGQLRGGALDSPAWSPDGTMVAVELTGHARDGDVDVFIVPVDGSRPQNLTDHPARDHQFAWSPPLAPASGGGLFVVDTTGDADDRDPGDGRCVDEEGACSLRAALEEANAVVGGRVVIHFDIPGAGPHTIVLNAPLPTIVEPVVIDGTTEPDYGGTPVVRLVGSLAG